MLSNLFCIPSERAFVGCIVSSNGSVLDSFHPTPEHFTDVMTSKVFAIAQGLHAKGAPVNRHTILREFHAEPMEVVQRITDVCFYPSPSQAGHYFEVINDKLTLRNAHNAISWASSAIEGADSAKDFCAELQGKFASLDTNATSENVLATTCSQIEEKLDRMARGEIVRGIPTKLLAWDNNFGGIMPGQLYALAGRPATGKTALLEMLIQQCLETGNPCSVFEKDMSPQKLIERMACRFTDVQYWRFAKGCMHDWEIRNVRKGLEFMRDQPLFLYNPTGLTAERMCQIVRRDVRVNGIKSVFLDHIQALKVGKDLREGLTQASLAIRANVTETNIPHIILAHINRNGAKGRPTPEDIKEFDQLYGDCDGMVILWTEQSRADMAADEMLTTKFYTAKNREGGPTEDEMLFDGATMTFKNKARE